MLELSDNEFKLAMYACIKEFIKYRQWYKEKNVYKKNNCEKYLKEYARKFLPFSVSVSLYLFLALSLSFSLSLFPSPLSPQVPVLLLDSSSLRGASSEGALRDLYR